MRGFYSEQHASILCAFTRVHSFLLGGNSSVSVTDKKSKCQKVCKESGQKGLKKK